MDDITKQRHAVKQVIKHYASLTPSHGDIRLDTVFDEEGDRSFTSGAIASNTLYQVRLNSRKTRVSFVPAAMQRVQTILGFFNRI